MIDVEVQFVLTLARKRVVRPVALCYMFRNQRQALTLTRHSGLIAGMQKDKAASIVRKGAGRQDLESF